MRTIFKFLKGEVRGFKTLTSQSQTPVAAVGAGGPSGKRCRSPRAAGGGFLRHYKSFGEANQAERVTQPVQPSDFKLLLGNSFTKTFTCGRKCLFIFVPDFFVHSVTLV